MSKDTTAYKLVQMNDLFIPADPENDTPKVDFKLNGDLTLEGKSFPEDPYKFYEPVFQWIKDLKKEAPSIIHLNIRLEYFNTTTGKLILFLFRTLEIIHTSKISNVKINWFYNKKDEDMQESGNDFSSLLDVPFESIEYE